MPRGGVPPRHGLAACMPGGLRRQPRIILAGRSLRQAVAARHRNGATRARSRTRTGSGVTAVPMTMRTMAGSSTSVRLGRLGSGQPRPPGRSLAIMVGHSHDKMPVRPGKGGTRDAAATSSVRHQIGCNAPKPGTRGRRPVMLPADMQLREARLAPRGLPPQRLRRRDPVPPDMPPGLPPRDARLRRRHPRRARLPGLARGGLRPRDVRLRGLPRPGTPLRRARLQRPPGLHPRDAPRPCLRLPGARLRGRRSPGQPRRAWRPSGRTRRARRPAAPAPRSRLRAGRARAGGLRAGPHPPGRVRLASLRRAQLRPGSAPPGTLNSRRFEPGRLQLALPRPSAR
jgi:hypothetical protein